MQSAQFKKVYDVSSEDSNYPAKNLLNSIGKKWISKKSGEKSIYVILELDKSSIIQGIDIGNEHSAFIEVLVNKKGSDDDNFEDILLSSSFMTPIESRNSTTTNRVRCFSSNALVESVATKKWDLIKIICTQPFNKHVQYGLSFIKIHTVQSPSKSSSSSSSSSSSKHREEEKPKISFGKFKLREESPDSPEETNTSLFARWKQKRESGNDLTKNGNELSAAASIREASSSASKIKPTMINKNKVEANNSSYAIDCDVDDEKKLKTNRNSSKILYGGDDDDDKISNEKFGKKLEEEKERRDKQQDKKKERRPPDKIETPKHNGNEKMKASSSKFKDFVELKESPTKIEKTTKRSSSSPRPSTSSSSHSRESSTSRKRTSSPAHEIESIKPEIKKIKLSETQKERIYKPFSKLLDGVVIVISGIQNPDRAEIRQKMIEMGARYKPDWDSNCTHLICAFKNTPKYNQVRGKGKIITKNWIEECYNKKIRLPWRRFALESREIGKPESEDEIYDESLKPINADDSNDTIELNDDNLEGVHNKSPEYDSGEDTEDELNRVKLENDNAKFDKSTDEDCEIVPQKAIKINCDFYLNKKFFINKDGISSIDIIKLKNFIRMYKGDFTDKPQKADIILSNKKFHVDDSNFCGDILKPIWVYECHDMECFLPMQRYKI